MRSSAGHNGGSCGSVGQMGRRAGRVMLPCPVRPRKQRRKQSPEQDRNGQALLGSAKAGLHCWGLVF